MRRFTAGVLVLAAAALGACAAPSRRLPPRVVNDPIVLPRRMASVAVDARTTWYPGDNSTSSSINPNFRVGLTDRLELEGLGLGYAILDDAPGSPRAPAPLSLAVHAGVVGIGHSDINGWFLFPTAGITAQKHVVDRWNVSLAADWTGSWFERPGAPSGFGSRLAELAGDQSSVGASARVTRQLGERFALSLGASTFQDQGCLAPLCSWTRRGAGGALLLWVRPASWVTVALGPNGGFRYRPLVLAEPESPTMPLATPPRSVGWVGAFGSAAFYW